MIEGAVRAPDRSPRTPASDPAFQVARRKVRGEAQRQKISPATAGVKRKEAEDASALPTDQQIEQSAKDGNVRKMQEVGQAQAVAGRNFSADSFKKELKAKIGATSPKTESQAKALAKNPPLEGFEEGFSSNLAREQGAVTGPLERQATMSPTGGEAEKPDGINIPGPTPARRPLPVDSRLATPKAKTPAEISQKENVDRLDGAMAQNRLDDDQLANSREPSFLETLKVKKETRKKIDEAPAAYRAREAAILESAQTRADQSLANGLGTMAARHGRTGQQVHGGQAKTESETERRQREIKQRIDGIYGATVSMVKTILDTMTAQVKEDFTRMLKEQTDSFNKTLKEKISDYYGDWRIDDELFGPDDVVVVNGEEGTTRSMTFEEKMGIGGVKEHINPDVYGIFRKERKVFLDATEAELDRIAENVTKGLRAAQAQIDLGRTMISIFKASLKGDELEYADQLEMEVKIKFENLESSIDDARSDLIDSLGDQYKESVDGLEKSFKEINDELKKSWLDRAVEFIETVGRTVFQLAELLLSILTRMASLVWDIVKHPIRFFETLVAGLMQGVGEFIGNIGTYLKEAFWTWITGTSAAKGIKVSESSGADSLFGIVLQVLNLTPPDLRAIVDKVLGPEFMQMVDKGMAAGEKVLEPVLILLNKGPGALWEYIKDSLSSIVKSTFERIKESVFFTFVEKGLKWVAGFFVPGGGFVKIIKAVFRAFQFVMENLDNIRHFFDSVFDSMEAATQGKTDGVAAKIINGLKTGVVLALDFLAKQLGLGKIVDSVQGIIKSLRRPIVSAIEWLLGKVKPFVTRMMAAGKEAAGRIKARVVDWWRARKQFVAGGVEHTMYFEGSQDGARLYVSRSPGRPISEFLDDLPDAARKTGAFKEAKDLAEKLEASRPAGESVEGWGAKKVNWYGRMATLLQELAGSDAVPPSIIRYGRIEPEVGSTRMEAEILTREHEPGTVPSESWPLWEDLHPLVEGPPYYVLGHMLNHNIGGKGRMFNLTPITTKANADHKTKVETKVKEWIGIKKKNVVYYLVEAGYGSKDKNKGDREKDLEQKEAKAPLSLKETKQLKALQMERKLARKLTYKAHLLIQQKGKWVKDPTPKDKPLEGEVENKGSAGY